MHYYFVGGFSIIAYCGYYTFLSVVLRRGKDNKKYLTNKKNRQN